MKVLKANANTLLVVNSVKKSCKPEIVILSANQNYENIWSTVNDQTENQNENHCVIIMSDEVQEIYQCIQKNRSAVIEFKQMQRSIIWRDLRLFNIQL